MIYRNDDERMNRWALGWVIACAVVMLLVTGAAFAQDLPSDEQIAQQERDLRNAYDARRAAAFAAGDAVAHRSWLLRLRMIEGAITARELQRLVDQLIAEQDDAPPAADPEPADRPGYRNHDSTDYTGWAVIEGQTFTGRPAEGARCRQPRTLYLNCTFEANGTGLWVQPDGADTRISDVHLVGCTFKNNWRGHYSSHSHGAYIERVDGLLIEGCVFEGNGWPNQGERPDYGLNHHLYISMSSDVTVRGCVFMDGLYHAVKFRNSTYISEHLYVEGNAFLTTPAPLAFSMNAADKPGSVIYRDIEVWDNVFAATPAWPPGSEHAATRLVEVNNADGVRVHGNLFVEGTTPGREEAVHVHPWGPNLNATISDNTSELTPFPAGSYTNANGYKLAEDDELILRGNVSRPPSGRTWAAYPGSRTDASAIIDYFRTLQQDDH